MAGGVDLAPVPPHMVGILSLHVRRSISSGLLPLRNVHPSHPLRLILQTSAHFAKMRFTTVALTSAAANLVAAAPFSFPLANGFPNLNATALAMVNQLAGGTQPTEPAQTTTPKLTAAGIQTLRLIAANELAEVAFFSELVSNITNGVPNYQCEDHVLASLVSILNVRSSHGLQFFRAS